MRTANRHPESTDAMLRTASTPPITVPAMGAARGKSFSDEQNQRMRAVANKLSDRLGSRAALAEALDVSPPTISNFLNGKNGAGSELAQKLANYLGRTLSELIDPDGVDAPVGPVPRALQGWDAAEARAREILSHTPAWVFSCARNLSGLNLPPVADVELVIKLANVVQQFPPAEPGRNTPETDAALAEVERIKREADRKMKRGSRKKTRS